MDATDDTGVARVDIAVDGRPLASPTQAPYAASWNATGAGGGPHTVTATARDAAGNATTAAVTVWRPVPADSTPPTVSITAPTNGASVSGTLHVTASATDDLAVKTVELSVDGAPAGTLASPPWSFDVDTAPLAAGSHTLRVRAYDAAGNSATRGDPRHRQDRYDCALEAGHAKGSGDRNDAGRPFVDTEYGHDGVAAYDVYRNGVLAGTTAAASFLDGGLAAGTTSSYQVFARDAAGNRSAGSSLLSVRTPALTTATTGTMSGAVFDALGKPLANALVKVTIGTTVKSAKTSNTGVWKLTSVPPGNYLLSATLTGYQPGAATATSVARQTTLTVVVLGR